MYRVGKEIAMRGFIERKNIRSDPGHKYSKKFFVSRQFGLGATIPAPYPKIAPGPKGTSLVPDASPIVTG